MAFERKQPLDAWLDRVGAKPVCSADTSVGDRLETYLINGRLAVVLRIYATGGGWHLFVPPTRDRDVASILDGAALALGVEGCHGLVEG